MNSSTDTAVISSGVTTKRVPFSLPFFADANFTIEPGSSIADLSEGIYLLLDIAGSISGDIAHERPNDSNPAHGLRALLAIAKGASCAVLSEIRPGIVDVESGVASNRASEVQS